MDCGPAALAALCGGLGVRASYGRLREACHTGVDGTSIDTIEDVANALGLAAEQVMLPVDQVLEPEVEMLPALVVTRLPNGFTHFVVAWRSHAGGRVIQLMDPAVGRRFATRGRFLADCYVHTMAVSATAWRAFASAETHRELLERRLRRAGHPNPTALIARAVADPGWRSLAHLDAAARMTAAATGGKRAPRVVERLVADAGAVPDAWWPVTPAGPDADGDEQVTLRGAVLVRVLGTRSANEVGATPAAGLAEIEAARREERPRPLRHLRHVLGRREVTRVAILVAGAVLAAAGTVVEALLLRAVFDRVAAGTLTGGLAAVVVAATAALLLLALPATIAQLGLGRDLEHRLRLAFLAKLPRLSDGYLHSRPSSDLAERCHSLHRLRLLPEIGDRAGRAAAELVITAAALIWLHPASAVPAAVAATTAVGVPLAFSPLLSERDLRLRTHQGALAMLTFDALLALVPLRAHRGAPALLRVHDELSHEWRSTAQSFQKAAVWADTTQAVVTAVLVGWLLAGFVTSPAADSPGPALLFVYWALLLPVLGYDVALALRRWPPLRTVVLRLLEPLGSPEEPVAPAPDGNGAAVEPAAGVAVQLADVTVVAGGHEILHGVGLDLEAGCHVALVGPSGAGKSTLLGLLLGWHEPASGMVLVDGQPFVGEQLWRLRDITAWVDPSVRLWNRSLADNLAYGASRDGPATAEVVEAAGLHDVLAGLPEGWSTALGEGGALVSGGEGQRVRLGRGIGRPHARLVVLDEPFRGLDRTTRARLLAEARHRWRSATLLCATHDVAETAGFDRVLVVEDGRVAEDGDPAALAADPQSRYRRLLDAETAARAALFGAAGWRRWRVAGGRMDEASESEPLLPGRAER